MAAHCAFDSELSILILQHTVHTIKVESDVDIVSTGVATCMETAAAVDVPSIFRLTKAEPEVGIFRFWFSFTDRIFLPVKQLYINNKLWSAEM